jgi:putative spermidine/putrescine transport system substrate-binding protein
MHKLRMQFLKIKQGRLLCGALAIVASAGLLSSCSSDKQDKTAETSEITVVSYGGGAYQNSHKEAYGKPFTRQTGINVNSVIWEADYDKLKAMVNSGKVTWDVVDVTASQYAQGQKDGLFAKLDNKPSTEGFAEGMVNDDGVASVYWGTVLTYSKAAFPKEAPKNWKDFWDTKRFPGGRSLYDNPRGNLEFALLADGVPKDKLYPLDVERAFRKLDQIKPQIKVWWKSGVEPLQLLSSKKVVLASVWSGRIYASKQAQKEVGSTWSDAALELNYWVIPRGSTKVAAASQFIEQASKAQAMAQQSKIVGYGPANQEALKHLPEDISKQLPTYSDNWDQSFVVDAKWWSENEKELAARWREWKAQ